MVIESTPGTLGPARRIGLITDDLRRSHGLAQDLAGELACDIYDLYGEESSAAPASAFIADLLDLRSDAVERLRRLPARVAGRIDPAIVGAFRTVAAALKPPFDRAA